MNKRIISTAVTALFILFSLTKGLAQKAPIEKVWYDEKKTCKIEIYKGANGKYYGKMVWLNEPIDKSTGKPQADKENPDPKLKTLPLLNSVMLRDFVQDPNNKDVYTDGTVYDADSGKTYCGKITFKGNKLDMRGYICSFSLFGRTETWTLAEGQ